MTLQIEKFVRKPFYVDAVQVTEENMEEVAKWCEGVVKTDQYKKKYIKVMVLRPLNERQTRAYATDWVLFAGTGSGFRVYMPKGFDSSFEPVTSGGDDPPTDIPAVQFASPAEETS